MAKLASSRPASRQGQQDAPVTRATRSGSRQPSEPPPTPQKGKGAAGKRGAKKAKDAADDVDVGLAPVEEDAADEDEQQEHPLAANDGVVAGIEDNAAFAPRNTQPPSVFSAFSGSTAQTSFSQEEISEMDPEIMVDVLPFLASAAMELSNLLLPDDPDARPTMRQHILTTGSKFNKLYHNRINGVLAHRDGFGSTTYIQPSTVLRALLRVDDVRDVPQGPWRPDSIIYRINLTTMLRTVLILVTSSIPNQQEYAALEDLAAYFGSTIAGPDFSIDAFHFCISLLRQLTLARMATYRPDPNFNPQRHVTDVFHTADEEGNLAFTHEQALNMVGLPLELRRECDNLLSNAVSEIHDAFDMRRPGTWDTTIEQLRAQNLWEAFVDEAINYYELRMQELNQQIAAAGGIDTIVALLGQEVESRTNASRAAAKRASFARPGGTPRQSVAGDPKKNMKALRAQMRKDQKAQKAAAASTAAAAFAIIPSAAPTAQMTDPALTGTAQATDNAWQRPQDDVQAAPVSVPDEPAEDFGQTLQEAIAKFDPSQHGAAKKAKARSLLDPQPGAHRVQFESQPTDDADSDFRYPAPMGGQGPYYQSSGRASNKRSHAAVDEDEPEEFDPTQDQGFETMDRDTAAADERRRQAPQAKRPQHAHPANIDSTARGYSNTPGLTQASPRRTTLAGPDDTQRRNPGQTIPRLPTVDPASGSVPPTADFQLAKIQARHATVQATQNRPAQVRNPWVQDEENALLDLIANHCEDGISYSALKKLDDHNPDGPKLVHRSPEDIRFKARNMKATMLKARMELPANWKYVVLDKKLRVMLEKVGVEYEQDQIRGTAATLLE